MAKDKLVDYDSTASGNLDVGGISVAEGMLPSNVNNAIREQMSHLKDFADGTEAINALAVDNLKMDGNTISSTDTNGDITLDPNGTGVVALSSDLTFGDNDKAIFGAGNDFQIYHDGSASIVYDNGTGPLNLQTNNSNINIKGGGSASDTMAIFKSTEGVELYYNAVKKFETTATGVDVTGGLNTTGDVGIGTSTPDETVQVFQTAGSGNNYNEGTLKVGGSTTALGFQFGYHSISSGRNVITSLNNGGGANQRISIGFGAVDSNGEPATNVMTLNQSGFVGIGESAPQKMLHITKNDSDGMIVLDANGTTTDHQICFSKDYGTGGTTGGNYWGIGVDGSENKLVFAYDPNAQASLSADAKVVIDSSGNVGISKSAYGSISTDGFWFENGVAKFLALSGTGTSPLYLNRNGSDGGIVNFYKDGSNVGSIKVESGKLTINSQGSNLSYATGGVVRMNNDSNQFYSNTDNTMNLGIGSLRWNTLFASNGTINTSDANEKQQITSLTDAEITAAKALSALFKTYKWNDAVAEKGDAARTHTGVIAQDVEAAMTAAGLDAADYAFWCSDTWWETQTEVPAVEAVEAVYEDVVIPAVLDEYGNEVEAERTEQRTVIEAVAAVDAYTRTDTYDTAEEAPEGAVERTRLGIRYPELLAFVGAATEQRLANIETRLAALEAN